MGSSIYDNSCLSIYQVVQIMIKSGTYLVIQIMMYDDWHQKWGKFLYNDSKIWYYFNFSWKQAL